MMMNDDLYDALLIAGVPEAKARAASVLANSTMEFVKEVFDAQEQYWRDQTRRTRRIFILVSVMLALQVLDIAFTAYRFYIIGAFL